MRSESTENARSRRHSRDLGYRDAPPRQEEKGFIFSILLMIFGSALAGAGLRGCTTKKKPARPIPEDEPENKRKAKVIPRYNLCRVILPLAISAMPLVTMNTHAVESGEPQVLMFSLFPGAAVFLLPFYLYMLLALDKYERKGADKVLAVSLIWLTGIFFSRLDCKH